MPDDAPLTARERWALIEYADEGYTLCTDMDDDELADMLEILMDQLFGETMHGQEADMPKCKGKGRKK